MKKILITALAAVFCFCSCMTSQEDYIYTIGLAWEGGNKHITTEDPEGMALVKEFEDAVDAFKNNNSHAWVWVETIYDGRISKADAAAKKKFEKYDAEFASLMDTYQAKFKALPVKKTKYSTKYTFKVYRSMGGDEVIASSDYEINYNN